MPPLSSLSRTSQVPFKPPRPIGAPSQPTSHTKQAGEPGDRATSNRSETTTRAQPLADKVIIDDDENSIDDMEMGDAANSDSDEPRPAEVATTFSGTSIPSKLLNLLIHENFKHQDTKVTKDAMMLVEKYIDTFVKEAIARAVAGREEANLPNDDGFLDVEDLEKLAPQLLLDF